MKKQENKENSTEKPNENTSLKEKTIGKLINRNDYMGRESVVYSPLHIVNQDTHQR